MGALRHRDFRLLWIGQSVSAVGDQLNVVAIAIFALERGFGASGLGLLLAARTIALLAMLPVAGTIADRVPRRLVMLAADVMRGGAVLALALTATFAPLGLAIGLCLVIGAGEALFRPAHLAVLPSLVSTADLPSANSLTSIATQSSAIVGPALAGGLIALGGVREAFTVDAATFAVSAATLLGVAEPPRAARAAQSVVREVAEGFRAVLDRPWIAAIILMATVHLLFVLAPWQVLLPVVARDQLGGTGAFALLMTVFAAGALLGAVIAGRLRTRRPGVVCLWALMPWALLPLTLVGPAPLWMVAVVMAATGAGEGLFGVIWITALQRDVPDRLLARVFSLDYLGSFAFLPVGLALAGPAAHAFGADAVLIVAALVAAVTTLPLLAFESVRRMATLPASGDGPRGPEPSPTSSR